MELDINKVLELYNKKLAELEHENILLKAQLEQLQEQIKIKEGDNIGN